MSLRRKTKELTFIILVFGLMTTIGFAQRNTSNDFNIGEFTEDWDAFSVNDSNIVSSSNPMQDYKLTWSGRVDNTVRIQIRGRSLTTRTISGRRASGVRYNFYSSLPRRNVDIDVDKKDGRGDVDVIQEPNRRNNYTAIIEIEDDDGGDDYYRLEIDWERDFNNDRNDNRNPRFNRNAEMTWSGYVDDVVQVRVRSRYANVRNISGAYPTNVRSNFRSSLPRNNLNVSVTKRDGRGSIYVVEQPSRRNNYTAVIEISDRRGGRDFYSFELNWNRNTRDRDNRGDRGDRGNRSGYMKWSGTVDDTVEITISGRSARTRTLRGQTHRNVRYNFSNSLPRRNITVRVDKEDGRGNVRVVQQPSRRNSYTAVVRITDSGGGRDNYEFELYW